VLEEKNVWCKTGHHTGSRQLNCFRRIKGSYRVLINYYSIVVGAENYTTFFGCVVKLRNWR
jgi:hypothetical protein